MKYDVVACELSSLAGFLCLQNLPPKKKNGVMAMAEKGKKTEVRIWVVFGNRRVEILGWPDPQVGRWNLRGKLVT